ncbi:TolB family protein [Microbacterium sp. P04]|uniref:TolB family protein n=1 Tax=Microbacterium sp. P04 TaxID=3366947 RepID=UPI0037467B4D
MNDRIKWGVVGLVAAIGLGSTAVVGVLAWQQHDQDRSAPSAADTVLAVGTGPADRVVFRNTAEGTGYGHVASVDLAAPAGQRAVDDLICDRVDAALDTVSCLRNERGIVPSYSATVYTAAGEQLAQWPLPGIPSRTRVSPDGAFVATTSFVTGHSYATVGFSTETVIRSADGESLGDLEEWTLIVAGEPSLPLDRNFWGVTFADDKTFYATVGLASSGRTYLVRGDISTRTLTTLAENVECPSLSPDGTRIAFKRVTSAAGAPVHWTPAVYDLATGAVTLLAESRGIDDQIEWLDDDTVLYALPRTDGIGDSDVWRLAADGSGAPELFIEHAWSPAVVRSTR